MGELNPDFGGETVVVTGASSGIGRAIALQFSDAGAAVIVADIQKESKMFDVPTHEAIRENGGTARFVETDVSAPDQISSAVEAAREFGGVDVMVNNAGIAIQGSILKTPAEESRNCTRLT